MKYTMVEGQNFPQVWEKALRECWRRGIFVRTDYDNSADFPSKDMTAMLVVHEPESEPMYHRAAFPMAIDELFGYIDEVVEGTRDRFKEELDYTYHDRLTNYQGLNQLDYVVSELNRAEFSRRAQAIIWNPENDAGHKHPPCLQRLWFRIIDGKLILNVHMRSNDLFKAAFSNMIAFYTIQKVLANELGVDTGEYCHMVDSLHIYGSYFEEVEKTLESFNKRSFLERTWTSEEVNQYKST